MKYLLFFNEAGQQDLADIGIKGLNLALLSKRGFKVPPGFIITKEVTDLIFENKEIKNAINDVLKNPDSEKVEKIQKLIKNLEFPDDVIEDIVEGYLSLSVNLDRTTAASLLKTTDVYVAVRSSYIDNRVSTHKTILNVKGKKRLFDAMLECYAALFTPDSIKNARENKVEFSTAVIVQLMVDSEKSGIAYSINPENQTDEVLIKACFGLGEGLVTGKVLPDVYTVDKKTLTVKDVKIGEKQYEYVRDIDTDETTKHKLGSKSLKQVMFDKDITELARVVKKIAITYGKPQEVEWALKNNVIYVLQAKELPFQALEQPERVEMEVYGEEEKPEIIDIQEKDIEEDLETLDEIEKYEREEPVAAEDHVKEEPFMDVKEEAESINEQSSEQSEHDTPEYTVFNKIDETPEESIQDDSIFSNYKELQAKEMDVDKLIALAKLNSGNIVVFCHMALKEKLKQKLKQYVRELPEDFDKILSELLEYENLEHENMLRKISMARNEFLTDLKHPDPDVVESALRLISVI